MAEPYDVAKYIEKVFAVRGEMQMQKLVYYSQAWHMVWNGRPLFQEPIEAWRKGPVVRSLRHTNWRIVLFPEDEPRLTDDEKRSIDDVIRHYGRHYGWVLSEQTHQELPWVKTRGDLPADANSEEEIPRRLIRSYYTEQSMRGEGPKRTGADLIVADPDRLAEVSRRNQDRWQGALDLLAQ